MKWGLWGEKYIYVYIIYITYNIWYMCDIYILMHHMFLEIYNAKRSHKKSDMLVIVVLNYQHLLEFKGYVRFITY